MNNKNILSDIDKEKLRVLNEKYKTIRYQSLIIAFIFISIFFILFTFLPIGLDNIALFVIGIWFLLQPSYIRKHSDYFYERAKLMPTAPSPSNMNQFFTFAGIFIIILGIIFMAIEIFFPHITSDEFFDSNEVWFNLVGFLIITIFALTIVYLIFRKKSAPSRGLDEVQGPAQERKGGSR